MEKRKTNRPISVYGEGREEQVFTFSQAVQTALKMSGNVEIFLPEGRYCVSQPVVITALQMVHITQLKIRGEENGRTVITGTKEINPQWKKYQNGIYCAQIEKGLSMDGLVCGGKQQIMARYPNFEEGVTLGGYSKDAISPGRVAKWKNPAGGYIRALHHAEWGGNSYLITGKDEENNLIYQWVGDNNRGSQMHQVKRMVENIFEELDAPREWFYEKNTGMLFFYPEDEEDLKKPFEAIVNGEIIKLIGSGTECPVSHITVENIHFTHTARTMFTGTYERVLRGDWGIVRAGVIYMENAESISILNSSFDQIGGNAVTISGYNKKHLIDGNDFTGIGATGVLVAGLTAAVRDPSFWDHDQHKTSIQDFVVGPKTEDYPRQIMISNNYFYDIGTYEKQASAVCLSVSSNITVKKNTVHHTSRAGINILTGAFGGHMIEDNDMFDCVTETSDHGPFNAWGRDRFWSVPEFDTMGKHGKDKRPFAQLDAYQTTTVRHNRIHGNRAFGLDFDDGATNYDIYNNLCIGVGIKTRDGFDRRVHNNLLIGCGFEVHMTFAQNNDLFYSNVVYFHKAFNNIFENEGATTFSSANLYWNGGEQITGILEHDYGSIQADPGFSDLENNDFSLKAGSPAFALGFVNFPMKDEDFGRADKPKPPHFYYAPLKHSDRVYRFQDIVLCDIDEEGKRSAAGLPDLQGAYILAHDVLGFLSQKGLPVGMGDVVVKLADQPVKNAQQFIQWLEKLESMEAGQEIELLIYRDQKPMQLHYVTV